MRLTGGRAAAAKNTLSTERNGESLVLKFSKPTADMITGMGMARAAVEWRLGELRICKPADGERGYKVTTARRLRLHVSFPSRGITLAQKPVTLDEPVEQDGALVFTMPAGALQMPGGGNG